MSVPLASLLSPSKKILVLAAGVCALAFPAAAQQAPASTTRLPPVTVQGTAPPAMMTEEARRFVQSFAAASNPEIDQIARWHDAVCVQVSGLPRAGQAAQVAGRIEEVARAVGLKVLAPGCRSNIQIAFTDQPQRLADRLGEPYLGFHYKVELRKVRAVTHPIQGWYATATAGAGGATGLAFGGGDGKGANPRSGDYVANYGQIQATQLSMAVLDTPDHPAPVGCADAPHFTACLRSMFMNVLVVVDNHAVAGRDLGAVSDYLAMMALSQPRSLDGCNALPSVIDLFAKSACPDRDPPTGLTPADASYLTALYASDPEAKMSLAKGDIVVRMASMLEAKAAAH